LAQIHAAIAEMQKFFKGLFFIGAPCMPWVFLHISGMAKAIVFKFVHQ